MSDEKKLEFEDIIKFVDDHKCQTKENLYYIVFISHEDFTRLYPGFLSPFKKDFAVASDNLKPGQMRLMVSTRNELNYKEVRRNFDGFPFL